MSASAVCKEANMENESIRTMADASQKYLVQLWSAQLNHTPIDISVDFFEAGGSSMQVIEMLMTVSSKFGREIDYAEFFKEPCIRKLSELLES
jgi:acyl carrier protein